MFSRNTKQILQFLGIAGVNVGLVAYSVREAERNHEKFKQLPRDEQRRLYNGCPLNKMGTSSDAIAAINESILLHDPKQIATKPIVPFDEAFPESNKNKM